MNFFNRKKKKENKNEQMEQVMASDARKSANELVAYLEGMDFSNKSGRFTDEQIKTYQIILDGLINTLNEAPPLTMDVQEIDKSIKRMAWFLQDALRDGCVEAAKKILEYIKNGVYAERDPIHGISKEDEDYKLELRNAKLESQLRYCDYILQLDKVRHTIEEYDEKIINAQKEYKSAIEQFEEYSKNNPILVKKYDDSIEKIKKSFPVDPDVAKYAEHKTEIVDMYNKIVKLKNIRLLRSEKLQTMKKTLDDLEIKMLTTQDSRITQELLEATKQSQNEFENTLKAERQEIKQMDSLAEEFNAALEQFLSDPDIKGKIIKTHTEYEKIKKEYLQKQKEEQKNSKLENSEIENNSEPMIN